MINFISVTLRNFMSFGNTESTFYLDGSGTTLITGKNLDDTSDGEAANGVGKTCLLNAITFALYAKPITDISTLDKLINNINKRNMFVSIIFEKNGDYYKVIRARKLKGWGGNGTFVEIYKNDNPDEFEDKHLITIASNSNEQIEKLLGISYELFVRIVLFTADRNSFFDLPERAASSGKASQTSIIETLFGLTEISEKANKLKEEIKNNNSDLKSLTLIQQQCLDEIERHEQRILNAKTRIENWDCDREIKIKQFEDEIELLSNVDIESQKALLIEYQSFEKKINELKNDEYYTLLAKQKENNKKIIELDNNIEHLKDDKCPFCKQEYAESKLKLKEYEIQQETLLNEVDNITSYIEKTNKKITQFQEKKHRLKEDLIVTSLQELSQIEKEQVQMVTKIEQLKQQTNPHIEALNELTNAVLPEPQTEEIEKLSKNIKHQQFLHKLLTKKDSFIRTVLLDKNIPFLNNRLTSYVSSLGLPHKIMFTHQLTIEITKLGETLDFGNLSTGQRARVNLALSLAFRDVLQKLHTPINLCIFDEVLDLGLDSVGVQLAVKLLKRKSREEKIKLYIISHREEITGSFNDNLKIIFSEGFSSIGEQ